jgi:hypothetical protein
MIDLQAVKIVLIRLRDGNYVSDSLLLEACNQLQNAEEKLNSQSGTNKTKGDVAINKEEPQTGIIEYMGIPTSHPNALELAQAQLNRLKKKEKVLDKIKDLIEME